MDMEQFDETAAEYVDDPELKPDYLNMTLSAGVKPIEMRFSQINSCYRKLPVAYRSFTYINSVIEGVVSPERYAYAADGTDRGLRISRWNMDQAMRTVKKLEDAGRKTEFVTARCTPKLALQDDPYAFVKETMEAYGFTSPAKICLEFPKTILFEDPVKVRTMLLSLKLLKVRSALAGCGEKDVPLTPLIDLPFDYVILAPWLTALVGDRTKDIVISSLQNFIRSLPCDIIADGLLSDQQISKLNMAGCYGYIPSPSYRGSVEHGRLRMPIDEAVLQKDEEG